jgi:hypothetical protein
MSLSEREKQLLDVIERSLSTNNPRRASALNSARPPRRTVPGISVLLAWVTGFTLLVVGLQANSGWGTVSALVGYGLIVGCCIDAVTRVGRRHRRLHEGGRTRQ